MPCLHVIPGNFQTRMGSLENSSFADRLGASMLAFAARTQRKHIPHLRTSFLLQRCRKYTNSPKQYKVTLDGGTLYVEQGVAEALGSWTQDTPIDGVFISTAVGLGASLFCNYPGGHRRWYVVVRCGYRAPE